MKKYLGGSSLIRDMFEEGKNLKEKYGPEKVFDFSLGNPNVAPPQEVTEAAIKFLEEEDPVLLHGYMSNQGFEDVREKIADSLNNNYDVGARPQDLIMVTGAAAGLNIILKSLVDPGDEIITFAPYFLEYGNYVGNYGGELIAVDLDFDTCQIDLIAFEKAISEKTKAIIINNPHNPTGVVFEEDLIVKMCDILREKEKEYGKKIFLISDEPYRDLVYDGAKVPFLSKYYDNTIICYSYSKSLSLPGERIGYVFIPSSIENSSDLVQVATVANRISGFVNAPGLFQKVIGECVDAKVDLDFYDNNRKKLLDIVESVGLYTVKPDGAFYLWVKAPTKDDVEFVQRAKKYNILMVPGSAFKGPGYVRLAYCVDPKVIENSRKAFEALMEEYR